MKSLLLDHNLSPRLVNRLSDLYPNSTHVESAGLATALDRTVWEYARRNDCMIVTKDADFGELGLLLGFPPKVVWIRHGNCSTKEIEEILREGYDATEAFSKDPNSGVIELF